MKTITYSSPIFGPVRSRRLGLSLGINLMPGDGKSCTFDCIYCECGLNREKRPKGRRPNRTEVAEALEERLQAMAEEGLLPNALTFAGNGEPTAHPAFADIIGDTIRLRDCYCPKAKVSVLSNGTQIDKEDVFAALLRVDGNIQKLDTVDAAYIKKVDQPVGRYDVGQVIEGLKRFDGHVIIQTIFIRGEVAGSNGNLTDIDNTGDRYVQPWLKAVKEIAPQQVMIYTIDRETPVEGIKKASREQLDAIRDRVVDAGIPCTASY